MACEDALIYIESHFLILLHRFRWVFCQLETLRHCLPASVQRILAELPETLDATYQRILQEIPKLNQVHVHRLLQCLTVAVRPLRVGELAEILAIDFNKSEEIPKLNEASRWDDQEQAVLSACSSLIAVIKDKYRISRVVQFSHLSVKEFLTSDRLAMSKMDASRYHHIPLEPAHTIMAQACLSVLLRLDPHNDEASINNFLLARYAVEHYVSHAEFERVLSHIWDGVDHLLDADKSHLAVWFWFRRGRWSNERPDVTPLYYVAERGYRGLVDCLISKRSDEVNVRGNYGTPLHAALGGAHADIAQLLLRYCVDVDVRDYQDWTPLHLAAYHGFLGVIRTLVERNADINARDRSGNTPLHRAMEAFEEPESVQGRSLDVVEFLLEHGADPDAKNDHHSTPLHQASYYGSVKGAQLSTVQTSMHGVGKVGHHYTESWPAWMAPTIPWIYLPIPCDAYWHMARTLMRWMMTTRHRCIWHHTLTASKVHSYYWSMARMCTSRIKGERPPSKLRQREVERRLCSYCRSICIVSKTCDTISGYHHIL